MDWIGVVHLVFGWGMVLYLLYPVITAWLRGVDAQKQVTGITFMIVFNRIGQFLLLLQFLGGGMYMAQLSKTGVKYTVFWMAAVVVILIVIGAFSGMMAKPLKQWRAEAENGVVQTIFANKVLIFSLLNALAYAVIMFMMYHPMYKDAVVG